MIFSPIPRQEFMMGRDSEFPTTEQMEMNAARLLYRVNRMLQAEFPMVTAIVSSGYRPGKYNQGFSPNSAHLTCEAIDIQDTKGYLDAVIDVKPWILEKYDLYREDPSATNGWVHLSTRAPGSGKRTFMP